MSTNKKDFFYIAFAPNCSLRLRLDPDIYTSTIAPILALGTMAVGHKLIDCSLAVAARSDFAKVFKVICTKGDEQRTIKLICDIDNADTAKALLIDKPIKLGYGTNATNWTIKEVR